MNKLSSLIESLMTFVPDATLVNEKISISSVGWHIDHSLLVMNKIITTMEKSNSNEYESHFNVKRFIAFILNRFPRGVAKAPKHVQPTEAFDSVNTQSAFMEINIQLKVFENLQKDQFFIHPYFGKLNKKAAEKMMFIHTKHHIKIIKEILQKQA